ncbi:MAG: hypothetical protein NVS9B4_00340 [Candidatus Acidiferrum sp.]
MNFSDYFFMHGFLNPVLHFQKLSKIRGTQIRAARALLQWDQSALARKAHVARRTVYAIENAPEDCEEETRQRIVAALERAGIEFLNTEEPGVSLRSSR